MQTCYPWTVRYMVVVLTLLLVMALLEAWGAIG